MLSLDMNERGDLRASDRTTLKREKYWSWSPSMRQTTPPGTFSEASQNAAFRVEAGSLQLQSVHVPMFTSEPGNPAEFSHRL